MKSWGRGLMGNYTIRLWGETDAPESKSQPVSIICYNILQPATLAVHCILKVSRVTRFCKKKPKKI